VSPPTVFAMSHFTITKSDEAVLERSKVDWLIVRRDQRELPRARSVYASPIALAQFKYVPSPLIENPFSFISSHPVDQLFSLCLHFPARQFGRS